MKFNVSCNSLLPLDRIIQDRLDQFEITYVKSGEGYFEIPNEVFYERKASLDESWKKYGLKIIEDERECLVQRIKNVLFENVISGKQLQQTLSCHLTEIFGLSYGYLTAIFSAITHCSIEQYVILMRIERAKRMIIEDEVSLKEISESLCYSSLGHFSKQFKKTTGITLSDFRNIIKRRKNAID
ncbi:AraC family transcriptional regulator [Flavobacterium sp.]|uniref:helix-turn-helix domain-containing protein n=1 Tax=Flavobacterium sp. TaxID=239 RepID=UPI001218C0A7|nr:AraC family transcriptional regulator [Flavobacterium sp.]RZJ70521.1 MAG: AraC family transcriptional regulator [Flavobacterium sp.]